LALIGIGDARDGSAVVAIGCFSVEEMRQMRAAGAVGDEVATAEQAPEPLNAEEMEILVARVALYPDELIAVITAASLYPVQIIEAQRFLDDSKTNKTLQPKATWDGSIVCIPSRIFAISRPMRKSADPLPISPISTWAGLIRFIIGCLKKYSKAISAARL